MVVSSFNWPFAAPFKFYKWRRGPFFSLNHIENVGNALLSVHTIGYIFLGDFNI